MELSVQAPIVTLLEAVSRLQGLAWASLAGKLLATAAPQLRQLCSGIAAIQAAIDAAGDSSTAQISAGVGRLLSPCEVVDVVLARHDELCLKAVEATQSGDIAELDACLEEEARIEEWLKEAGHSE